MFQQKAGLVPGLVAYANRDLRNSTGGDKPIPIAVTATTIARPTNPREYEFNKLVRTECVT
jgi:hypothetical protein